MRDIECGECNSMRKCDYGDGNELKSTGDSGDDDTREFNLPHPTQPLPLHPILNLSKPIA